MRTSEGKSTVGSNPLGPHWQRLHPTCATCLAWGRKPYHRVITLTPLAPPDGYQMLTARLGTPHIQDDLVTLVLDKVEGVPFFLEELVTALRETGAIALHDGQWRLTARAPTMPL